MTFLKINSKDIYFSENIQRLCLKQGGSFPKGCPNYGKKKGCPPQPLIDKIFDLSKTIYMIYTEFKIGKFAERMGEKHPKWSEKMKHNSRYWQPRARKEHKKELEKFLEEHSNMIINKVPEGHGVNVHKLFLRTTGKNLEWPPRKLTRLISLAGYAKP